MTAYMINGHGAELLHTNPIPLAPGEKVIMLCDWGCPLYVKSLFNTFVYTHVAKVNNEDELYALLLNPEIKGAKYAPLKFIKNIMCEYRDAVPELELEMDDPDFRAGLHELPVVAVTTNGKRASGKQLSTVKDKLIHKSYYYRAGDTWNNVVLLSGVLERIRNRVGGRSFTIVAFVCRDIVSRATSPKKLRDIKK